MPGLAPTGERVYKKVVVQAAYHANLVAWQKAPEICQGWLTRQDRQMFPQWGVGPAIVEVKNAARHKKFYIAAKSAGAEWENVAAGDLKQELQQAGSFLNELAEKVPSVEMSRFGLRFYYLLPFGDFDELRRLLLEACTRWDRFASSFGASDADVGVSWQFDAQGGRVNVSIGPVERKELGKFFESSSVEDIALSNPDQFVPDVALLFDGDYSVREQPLKDVRRLILKGQEALDSMFEQFVTTFAKAGAKRL